MAPGFTKIIHPETLAVAEVPESSLRHHYASGWRLLAPDEEARDVPEPEPEPVTMAAAKAAKAAKAVKREEN